MEFYEEISAIDLDSHTLQQKLSIHNLPILCRSINTIITDNKSSGLIYCLWGEFEIHREELNHGVRFTLPKCPNAVAWTITNDKNIITVHCTINKKTHDDDFIASLYVFMADWATGLKQLALKIPDPPISTDAGLVD